MWQPGWERSLGENGYMYIYGWVPSLFTWNYHNIVNQLYPNTKLKVFFFFKSPKNNKEKKKQVWWNVCFILDAGNGWGWGHDEGDTYKARLTTTWQSGRKSFSRQRGPHAETAVSSDSHLEIGHVVVWPASSWLLLNTIILQFQGQFISISLRQILRIVAAYVMATVWLFCS